MTHGSLFSGIGGFDLAAEWMGWENKFHCEWNPFGQKVLKYYWPESESFKDITKTDFTKYANTIDILTGGFPCQPYSLAGKRKGKDDDRHLWPEMLRTIREVKPRWVVGENVRGLLNWNGGLVFDEVCADLENLGYKVAAYLIPAASVNAPHKRERIWIVANTNNTRFKTFDNKKSKLGPQNRTKTFSGNSFESIHSRNWWETFPTVSPICDGNDGFSDRLDGITFSKWRTESIRAGGNAICPQVVYQIFKAIEQYERLH